MPAVPWDKGRYISGGGVHSLQEWMHILLKHAYEIWIQPETMLHTYNTHTCAHTHSVNTCIHCTHLHIYLPHAQAQISTHTLYTLLKSRPTCSPKPHKRGWGMTRWLGAYTTLAEDLRSVHISSQPPVTPALVDQKTLTPSVDCIHIRRPVWTDKQTHTQTHTPTHHRHIIKIVKYKEENYKHIDIKANHTQHTFIFVDIQQTDTHNIQKHIYI